MVQLKTNGQKVVAKDGEVQVTISLELNINLNSDGLIVGANASNVQQTSTKKQIEEKDEKIDYAIPNFKSKNKLNFGKDG